MDNSKTAETIIDKACARLVLTQPFFAAVLMKLKRREDPTCQTAWVDGVELGYNADFVAGLTDDEVLALVVHETMHVVLAHHLRRGERDPKVWNEAADYAINWEIRAAGLTLPQGGLIDAQYQGLGTEQIYAQRAQQGQQGNPQQQGQQGKPQQGQQGQQGDKPSDQPGEKGQQGQQGTAGDENGAGQGQGAPDPSQGSWGEVRDFPAQDEAQHAEAERALNVSLGQAARAARKAGNLPGNIARIVDETLNPAQEWADVLRDFMEDTCRDDVSWSTPNRRLVHTGIYLPGSEALGALGEVVVAIDTSSSIDRALLSQFAAEFNAIAEDVVPDLVHVVSCDTQVQRADTFDSSEFPVEIQPQGRGGTKFAPVFRWVEDQGIAPRVLLYFTDMGSHDFGEDPGYPVLWINYGSPAAAAPFGQVIPISK